jgi:hypothetical protein
MIWFPFKPMYVFLLIKMDVSAPITGWNPRQLPGWLPPFNLALHIIHNFMYVFFSVRET